MKLPRAGQPEKTFLTAEQGTALADAAGEPRTVILVLSYCGLRWGETAALRVSRVDTMRRRFDIAAGANVKAVQRMLGHASTAMTLDVYAGLFDDDLDGLADRMDDARVYSACTQADARAKGKKALVSEIRSAATESA